MLIWNICGISPNVIALTVIVCFCLLGKTFPFTPALHFPLFSPYAWSATYVQLYVCLYAGDDVFIIIDYTWLLKCPNPCDTDNTEYVVFHISIHHTSYITNHASYTIFNTSHVLYTTYRTTQRTSKQQIKIKIPGSLKKKLIADWEFVTRNRQIVDLPRKPSVTTMLDDFKTCKKRTQKE